MRVAGATVLVTGASSGIGAATARAVARAGGRPVLLARSADRLEAIAAELGPEARAYPIDCSDRDAVAELAPRIERDVGTPDVIVNSAGAGRWLFFDDTSLTELEEMLGAPFSCALHVTRAFLPAMIARGSGLVLSLNTPIAFVAWQGAAGYGISRWALRGLHEVLDADLAGTGVKVSQVVPAFVSSAYLEHNPGVAEAIPGIKKVIPTRSPEQVAKTVLETIESEKRLVYTPLVLRLIMASRHVFPGLVPYVTRKTARRRPAVSGGGERAREARPSPPPSAQSPPSQPPSAAARSDRRSGSADRTRP